MTRERHWVTANVLQVAVHAVGFPLHVVQAAEGIFGVARALVFLLGMIEEDFGAFIERNSRTAGFG